ncbi:MAG: DUF6588 family protein [Bacteroidota bacterium]
MKKLYIIFALALASFSVKAQDFEIFLETGAADANLLLENYFTPVFQGFGYGINGGWLNTAKPHKSLGFDLTITASLARVPDDNLMFTFNNADYQNVQLRNGTSAEFPTFFGPTTDPDNLPQLVVNGGESSEFRITPPQGFDLEARFGMNAVPAPMAQLGIGLFKNTELKVRWSPEIDLDGEGNFKLLGFGLLHDVKQWIPGLKLTPIDISAFVGYTTMTSEFIIDDNPSNIQKAVFDVNGLVIQGMVSKQFSILTLYGGVGYNTAKTNFSLLGDYDREGLDLPTDPVDFDFSTASPRITAGLRIKLAVITLHADYTLQEYSLITAGFGISVR